MASGEDFLQSFEQWPLWKALAFNDILSRYRGSMLGPFWITVTTVSFVVGISLVYSSLMHIATEKYVPWLTCGVVIWNTMASTILESGEAFVSSSAIIRGVAVWFHFLFRMNLPMAVVGFALVLFNISWIAFAAAILSARFRDIQQVIATLMQLIFFVSPVIWMSQDIHGIRSMILTANPFYHLLEVTRDPLLGLPTPLSSIGLLLALGAIGWTVTFLLYATVRRRIVHYL